MDVARYATEEPTVVVTGRDANRLAERLADAADVVAVAGIDGVRSLLSAADDPTPLDDRGIDAVVTGSDLPTGQPSDLVAAVRESSAELPVVVAPAEPAPGVAARIAAEPATHYLPRSHADAGDLAALVEDVVETHDRRRQAASEQAMFREVLEEAPLAVYVKDEEVRHLAVSSEADRAVDGRAIGRTDRELFGEDGEVPDSYEDDLAVVESGEPVVDQEEVVHLEGGKDLWLRTTKVPRTDEDGEVVGLVGVTRDVSPEKQREQELLRETRRLEQFASFASHDLRNPVTIAQGYLERARAAAAAIGDEAGADGAAGGTGGGADAPADDGAGAGVLEPLDEVAVELERMEQLIDDLLTIARPDEERSEEWTDLEAVVERAWTAVDAPSATLSVDLPDDFEVRASSGALRQLLENLLDNAVVHGGPDVSVEVGLTDTGFYVSDDGPGIPEAEREEVFEYGVTTGGTGVGLAIVAEIAEAHGWEPRATESEAGGARVEFARCLTRRQDRPEPVEGERVELTDWRTVGGLEVEGGAARDDADRWTIRGGGEALWVGIEEYATLAADVDGDVRIEARLLDVERCHDYSKAGLLLTDATEPESPLGFVGMTAGHGTEAAWRAEPGDVVETRQAEPDAALPRWYRVDRVGDRVSFWASADGEDWTLVDRHVLPLSEPVSVGLMVNSHEPGTTCAATFEDVRVVELDAASQ